MDNMDKNRNLLAYLRNPLSKESVLVLYDSHNIKYEKCELYNDFVQSLLIMVFDTYMGDEVTELKNQIKHFRWCWVNNLDNFNKEGIVFESPLLYEYFLQYMLEIFYSEKDKSKHSNIEENCLDLWSDIFNYTKPKTNSDMDMLIEICRLFDDSMVKSVKIK